METGWYDLAQIAITPAGWYDFVDRNILPGSPPMSGISPFQRSYAYVLAHGLDAVNADMQSFAHLEQNVTATASSSTYFV